MGLNSLGLKAARVKRGLTQKAMATTLRTTASNYANKENGHTSISLTDANKIAKALALSPREIVDIFFST